MALIETNFSALPSAAFTARLAEVEMEVAAGRAVNFGFVHEGKRTQFQNENHQQIVAAMPPFKIQGAYQLQSRRYKLWDYARKALKGKWPPWIWQQTGSCVGAGGGQMQITTQGVEIVLKGEAQVPLWPWWLFTYGKSRQRGGLHGPGEGSFGSAWAESACKDGLFEIDPVNEPDLPNPVIQGGWAVVPSALEMEWSNGSAIDANWSAFGQKRLFKTSSRMRSADDCIAAMANGYSITAASMFGFSPMTPPQAGSGENAIRLVKNWNAQWCHQMSIHEFWDHPDCGPVFGWMNNWGPTAHGDPVGDYPTGAFYTTLDIVDRICRSADGEVYAFSAYDGFPAREAELTEADFYPFGSKA